MYQMFAYFPSCLFPYILFRRSWSYLISEICSPVDDGIEKRLECLEYDDGTEDIGDGFANILTCSMYRVVVGDGFAHILTCSI